MKTLILTILVLMLTSPALAYRGAANQDYLDQQLDTSYLWQQQQQQQQLEELRRIRQQLERQNQLQEREYWDNVFDRY